MTQLFDHIVWHCLTGPHAQFSTGAEEARRYAPGFSPIIGFAPHAARPNFAALADYCEVGEQFYCQNWSGTAPAGWQINAESTVFKMVWEGKIPLEDAAPEAIRLGPEHVAQAMELTALTHPGPFGPRTIELGEYYGIFDGKNLIAMAGERLYAGGLREISGVCTHPDFQGHGLARCLMLKLIRHQVRRGEVPFLHVMRDNAHAHGLYERLGFCDHQETVIRVISLC